jgi:branched-chain amino acid transport system ATP-binding protein
LPSFVLAEQNTNMALKYADYGYIMESGRIVMDGAAKDLANNEDVKEFYLGVGGGEQEEEGHFAPRRAGRFIT